MSSFDKTAEFDGEGDGTAALFAAGASQAVSLSHSASCGGECSRDDCEDCGRGKGDCARGSFAALFSWVAGTGGLGERRPLSQDVLVFAAVNDGVEGAGDAKAGAVAVGADSNAPFEIYKLGEFCNRSARSTYSSRHHPHAHQSSRPSPRDWRARWTWDLRLRYLPTQGRPMDSRLPPPPPPADPQASRGRAFCSRQAALPSPSTGLPQVRVMFPRRASASQRMGA